MAAALSVGHILHIEHAGNGQLVHHPNRSSSTLRTKLQKINCRTLQGQERHGEEQKQQEKEKKKEKLMKRWWGLVAELKERPKHRAGDWKDLFLMSFSFAVYIYISQRIVCAYCAWISILKHSSF